MSNDKITKLSGHCKDLTGHRFCRLVVLECAGKDRFSNLIWKCQCDCGNICEVAGHSLNSGRTKSCGCLKKERVCKRNKSHGMSKSPEYDIWKAMLQRCENPNCKSFSDYGGRGIKVCQSWHKFENFYRDMGKRPEGLSIDRINNDGNYEMGNCRWATKEEQSNNSRPKSKGPAKQRWFRSWRSDQMCQYLSNNQSQFARDHGLCNSSISICLMGKRKSHRDWSFRRIPPPQV